jgi:hypothetical protein
LEGFEPPPQHACVTGETLGNRLADVLFVHLDGQVAVIRELPGCFGILIAEEICSPRSPDGPFWRAHRNPFFLFEKQGGRFANRLESVDEAQYRSIPLYDRQLITICQLFEGGKRGFGIEDSFF